MVYELTTSVVTLPLPGADEEAAVPERVLVMVLPAPVAVETGTVTVHPPGQLEIVRVVALVTVTVLEPTTIVVELGTTVVYLLTTSVV